MSLTFWVYTLNIYHPDLGSGICAPNTTLPVHCYWSAVFHHSTCTATSPGTNLPRNQTVRSVQKILVIQRFGVEYRGICHASLVFSVCTYFMPCHIYQEERARKCSWVSGTLIRLQNRCRGFYVLWQFSEISGKLGNFRKCLALIGNFTDVILAHK